MTNIYHINNEHLAWALAEKARLDQVPVPPGKIVFLGSNPSCSSPYNDPFSHCKSANRIINEWIPALGLTRDQIHFMNVANYKTFGNKPLKTVDIQAETPRLAAFLTGQVVVTLGAGALKAMELVRANNTWFDCVQIEMPHPSGRNRVLNDKVFVQRMLVEAKDKIHQRNHNVGEKQ